MVKEANTSNTQQEESVLPVVESTDSSSTVGDATMGNVATSSSSSIRPRKMYHRWSK